MSQPDVLREQLLQLLNGRNAHMNFADAVADFPISYINTRPLNVPYTPWHLLEHIRISQADILEFIKEAEYTAPKWPDEYWPDPDAEADEATWWQTIASIESGLEEVEDIVRNPVIDLLSELPHAEGYTYLREVMLVADHNAYHIGEFAILRQVMETW